MSAKLENKDHLSFLCKVKQTSVKEEKSRDDGIVITKFTGSVTPGLFSQYSPGLELSVNGLRFWTSINTGEGKGNYFLRLNDRLTGIELVNIGGCVIKDVQVAVGKEDLLEASIFVRHEQTAYQNVIEAAVSTTVQLALNIDDTIMGGDPDADESEA